MFRIFGVGSLVVCLLHVLVQYLIRNKDLDKGTITTTTATNNNNKGLETVS